MRRRTAIPMPVRRFIERLASVLSEVRSFPRMLQARVFASFAGHDLAA